MTAHTPGPWSVEAPKKIDGKHYAAGECFKVWPAEKPPGGWAVASIATQSPNHEANARLIAATPDLLVACKALLDCYFDYHDSHHLTQPVTGASGNASNLAIAAIAKAESAS